jgi:hypothetical protein
MLGVASLLHRSLPNFARPQISKDEELCLADGFKSYATRHLPISTKHLCQHRQVRATVVNHVDFRIHRLVLNIVDVRMNDNPERPG